MPVWEAHRGKTREPGVGNEYKSREGGTANRDGLRRTRPPVLLPLDTGHRLLALTPRCWPLRSTTAAADDPCLVSDLVSQRGPLRGWAWGCARFLVAGATVGTLWLLWLLSRTRSPAFPLPWGSTQMERMLKGCVRSEKNEDAQRFSVLFAGARVSERQGQMGGGPALCRHELALAGLHRAWCSLHLGS